MTEATPDYSVVVPAYNEEALLPRTLSRLREEHPVRTSGRKGDWYSAAGLLLAGLPILLLPILGTLPDLLLAVVPPSLTRGAASEVTRGYSEAPIIAGFPRMYSGARESRG